MIGGDPADLRRTVGESARIWASQRHEVHRDWWLALSGRNHIYYNLACCGSAATSVLSEGCLEPILDAGKPGSIVLAGAGLATAQSLVDAGWVSVGALPLLFLARPPTTRPDSRDERSSDQVFELGIDDLPAAREVLEAAYALDANSSASAVPDFAAEQSDTAVWGVRSDGRMVACLTSVVQDGFVVIWSMATLPDAQGQGHGRKLLSCALAHHFGAGVKGSLLHSSAAGEKLYRSLGYTCVEYWQLWSRPRWAFGYN